MSSVYAFVRLARHYTVRAVHDERYARGLLDGYAEDATADAPLEQLDLLSSVWSTLRWLEEQARGDDEHQHAHHHQRRVLEHQVARDMADTLHFALYGTTGPTTKVCDRAWLHPGLDTHYGWPAVLMEASVARLALELPAIADALPDYCGTEIGQLAAFYQAAARAGQVMIVAVV